MAKKKNPIGRPEKYKEEYCDMLIKHMEQGLSYESFAGLIGVARETLYKWEERLPAFLHSKMIGKSKLLLTMEKLGLSGMTGKVPGWNASTYIFTMKNKCDWSDKVEQSVSTNAKITIDTMDDGL